MKKFIATIKKTFESMNESNNCQAINPMAYYIVNRSMWH